MAVARMNEKHAREVKDALDAGKIRTGWVVSVVDGNEVE